MKNIENISLGLNNNGYEVLNALEKGGCQIVLILDKKMRLVGTISDGDLRRIIINGKSLNLKTSEIMNKNFFFLKKGENKKDILRIMQEKNINQVPILEDSGTISELILLREIIQNRK